MMVKSNITSGDHCGQYRKPKTNVVPKETHGVVGRVPPNASEYTNAKVGRFSRGRPRGLNYEVSQVNLPHSMRKGHQPDESRTVGPNQKRLMVTANNHLLCGPSDTRAVSYYCTKSYSRGVDSNVTKVTVSQRQYRQGI